MSKPKSYIPEHAKLVFTWKTYDTWQWEQEMYDGSVKIFEKIKRLNEVSVIVVKDGQILIQKQEQPHRDPFISLPGWRCEINEEPLETAKRELLEETGLTSNNILLWRTIPSPYSTIVREAFYYIAKDCQDTWSLHLDNWEKIKNYYISIDDFIMLSENESFRDTDLVSVLLRMRLHPEMIEEFKLLISN